jgi:ubiquitin C-terminal hydrolase
VVNLNSNALLSGEDAVFCGNCNMKTSQKQARDYDNADLLMLEIVRVTKLKNNWIKNSAPLSFDTKNLQLPGFLRPYRVVGSCHHRGSLVGGHWITKIQTQKGWFEMDDLKRKCRKVGSPGVNDESVSVLLLIAEDRFGT